MGLKEILIGDYFSQMKRNDSKWNGPDERSRFHRCPPSVIIMFFYPFLISFSWTFTESLVRLLFFCFSSHKPQKIKEKKITCWSCLVLFVSASMFSFSSSSFYVLKLRPLHYILNLIYSCLVVLDIVFTLLSTSHLSLVKKAIVLCVYYIWNSFTVTAQKSSSGDEGLF